MHLFFGGSFDPIHIGHLIVGRDVLEKLRADKLTFIPTYQAPLKEAHQARPLDRLSMIKLAIKDQKNFQVSDIEIKRGGISYTVDTVMELFKLYSEKPYFVMGADSLLSLHLWKEPQKVTSLACLVVVDRFNKAKEILKYMKYKFPHLKEDQDYILLEVRRVDVSSTEIRERVRTGKSIRWLVPQEVEDYIIRKGLYK